ncbi:MAG TPA: MerR family transcriptional regulator [Streptosporangiaceae bacterium]
MTSWTISQVAEKSGLSAHTLRWYERIGLLDRVERGPDGRRRYSEADLEWVVLLNNLRTTGMRVRDMQRYAELVRSGGGEAERMDLLEQHRELVLQSLAQQEACLRVLDRKIKTYRRRQSETQAGPEPASTEGAAAECAPPTLVT